MDKVKFGVFAILVFFLVLTMLNVLPDFVTAQQKMILTYIGVGLTSLIVILRVIKWL